jgi:hypothetical protein
MGNSMPESTLKLYAIVDFVPQVETLHLASVLNSMWDIGDSVDMKYRGRLVSVQYVWRMWGRGLSDHVTYVGG